MQTCNVRFSASRVHRPGAPWIAIQSCCCFSGCRRLPRSRFRAMCLQPQSTSTDQFQEEDKDSYIDRSKSYLHVQSLRNFPIEKLCGEVVLVRLDSTILLGVPRPSNLSRKRTLTTIKYLYKARAKVLLVTSWDPICQSTNPALKSTDSFAEYMSSLLQIKVIPINGAPGLSPFRQEKWVQNGILLLENLFNFRGEIANCLDFSQKLASGATILVNDSFSLSHKILASTVGVTRFCHASLAGFHFEEELVQLLKITDNKRRPYVAIIGGSNFLRKAPGLHLLASQCDGLFFVGKLAFQIMNGIGISVPARFVEGNAFAEVLKVIEIAHDRNIPIYYPTDLWCFNNNNPDKLEVFNSNEILSGWTPADIGPSSLDKVSSLIPLYKKILWIGPTNYDLLEEFSVGASQLGQILEKASQNSCDVILAGSAACNAVEGISDSLSQYKTFQNASVVWEFLKGRILPGIAALDKNFPYQIPWNTIYSDPARLLIVDIGSGNGLFLFKMARNWEGANFLGLEINEKLVRRCLKGVLLDEKKNIYFISTNATSTFRSIISSYPGDLILVAIQCPNPDFNKEQYRWRMVQQMLVEAITDLLQTNGKVYLQSDVEAVLLRMKEQFITHGKGRIVVDGDDEGEWMENPFGVVSDWEQHVLARGAPMYRIMLRKVR